MGCEGCDRMIGGLCAFSALVRAMGYAPPPVPDSARLRPSGKSSEPKRPKIKAARKQSRRNRKKR